MFLHKLLAEEVVPIRITSNIEFRENLKVARGVLNQ